MTKSESNPKTAELLDAARELHRDLGSILRMADSAREYLSRTEGREATLEEGYRLVTFAPEGWAMEVLQVAVKPYLERCARQSARWGLRGELVRIAAQVALGQVTSDEAIELARASRMDGGPSATGIELAGELRGKRAPLAKAHAAYNMLAVGADVDCKPDTRSGPREPLRGDLQWELEMLASSAEDLRQRYFGPRRT